MTPPVTIGPIGVESVLERGHQAQVAAAAAQAPEQIGVLGGAGREEAPVGGDDIGRQEIVDDETALGASASPGHRRA